MEKAFCRHCGTHLFNDPIPPGEIPGETEEERADREKRQKTLAVNIRCLNFDDLAERVYPGMPQVTKFKGWTGIMPQYVNP